jgi:AcrR family transcriptional regulator
MSETRPVTRRLPALERREAIVRAALRVFTSTSYAGATTAEIAREAGVSEPVLYRHFASKRDLWLACLDVAWDETRCSLQQKIASFAGDAGHGGARSPWRSPQMPNLWIQGLTEAGEDPVVRRAIRRHMREVHDFVADEIRRGQQAGRIPADRDANAEGWVFIGGGLLRSVADRLGGVLTTADLEAISRARVRWLTGG